MPDETVVVLGAGATKACGGPLTNEILPWAFEHQNEIEREGYLDLVRRFIVDLFEVDPAANPKPSARLPSLTLLLSLIDIALDRRESLSPRWPDAMPLGLGDDLARVRHAFDYVIFAVLEQHLLRITDNPHVRLFKRLQETCGAVRVISLNYDIIAVNSIIRLAEETSGPGFADYCCQIATRFHIERPKIGTLLKLHGSLNWMYCPNCHRLELGVSGSGRYTAKVLDELYQVTIARSAAETLEERYSCHGSPCLGCGTFVRAVLISPSFQKDYRHPHITAIWQAADGALRAAKKVLFIGYSLPEDDIHVQYLLKRSAGHLKNQEVTVVDYDPAMRPAIEHPVGQRYIWLFGDGIDWHPEGFQAWLDQADWP